MKTQGAGLTIRLLGRFEVKRDGEPVPEEAWGHPKTRELLKVLLADPGTLFSEEELVGVLFPEENSHRALASLYARVNQLWRVLEPNLERGADSQFVHRADHGYRFNSESCCWVDTLQFLQLKGQGDRNRESSQDAEAINCYEEAIKLWGGEFLEPDRYEEWTLEVRLQWQERYIAVLTQLADAYAAAGDRHRAVMACRTAFDLRPSREPVLRQLMRYHHAAGDRSEALQVYKRGVEALKRDLGVEPSAETVALREAVLEEAIPDASRDRTRIAVLPLVNVSPDPEDEHFADGMTEELIYTLSKIEGLRVIAQTSVASYKNTDKTVSQIGRELSIGTVIEGSVRKAEDRVRITIQLIDVGSEEHLWAEKYDREFKNVFAIQSDIAQRVAGALRVELLDEAIDRLKEEPTVNLKAYTLYLKGRHFLKAAAEHPPDVSLTLGLGAEELEKAIEYFTLALEADPDYALAWSGLADARCLLWFLGDVPDADLERAEKAADRAVALDPQLGEGYGSQGLVRWIGRKNVDEARRLLEKATALSPKNPTLHRWSARILRQLDRRGEAMLEILRAGEIDPLSPTTTLEFADLHMDSGRLEDAIQQAQSVLELHPSHVDARLRLASLKIVSWDWDGAEAECLRVIEIAPTDPRPHLIYSELLLCLGRRAEGEASLKRGVMLAGDPCSPDLMENIGLLYYMLGDLRRALQIFERTAAERPRFRFSYWWVAICHWRLGDYDEALKMLRKVEEIADGFYRLSQDDMALGIAVARGLVHAAVGDRVRARQAVDRARGFPEGMPRRALGIAAVLFHLGDVDEGFEWLRRAVEERCPNLPIIEHYALPEAVTKDPRYAEILKPTGLPTYPS